MKEQWQADASRFSSDAGRREHGTEIQLTRGLASARGLCCQNPLRLNPSSVILPLLAHSGSPTLFFQQLVMLPSQDFCTCCSLCLHHRCPQIFTWPPASLSSGLCQTPLCLRGLSWAPYVNGSIPSPALLTCLPSSISTPFVSTCDPLYSLTPRLPGCSVGRGPVCSSAPALVSITVPGRQWVLCKHLLNWIEFPRISPAGCWKENQGAMWFFIPLFVHTRAACPQPSLLEAPQGMVLAYSLEQKAVRTLGVWCWSKASSCL